MTDDLLALKKKLAATAEHKGGLPLPDFFGPLLIHYYNHETIFGITGDFTTAPEISPLLGATLALRIGHQASMATPANGHFTLLEIGAGRGTLMADIINHWPKNGAPKPKVIIVDQSQQLIKQQQQKLQGHDYITWHKTTAELTTASVDYIVANELVDCLLPRQFVFHHGQWQEQVVGYKRDANHANDDGFYITTKPLSPADAAQPWLAQRPPPDSNHPTIYCYHPTYSTFMAEVKRLLRPRGIATIIDYGHDHTNPSNPADPADPYRPASQPSSSIEAIYRHRPCALLQHLGQADLSSPVDFAALKQAATTADLSIIYHASQAQFLHSLHGEKMAAKLVAMGYDDTAMASEQKRLMASDQPTAMGRIFQVLELSC